MDFFSFLIWRSIFEYSGSAIIAMKGKNCGAIASDKRFGIQLTMITPNTEKIFRMSEKVMVGLAGLPVSGALSA